MVVILMVGVMLAAMGYYLFLLPPVTKVAQDEPSAEIIAAAMLVYQKAAVDWCLRTACADGPIASANLILPPGYTLAPWIAAAAQGGRVSTYMSGVKVNTVSIAASLGDLTTGGPSAGLTGVDATGQHYVIGRILVGTTRVPVVVNGTVPQGAPVVSQQVK